jgi:hypothetical protein
MWSTPHPTMLALSKDNEDDDKEVKEIVCESHTRGSWVFEYKIILLFREALA